MRAFVTGGSGHVGSAVIADPLDGGHEVSGLARSDEAAAVLEAAGAKVHRGSLDDLDTLKSAAVASDDVIHLGFKHDEGNSGDDAGAVESDLHAIEAIGDALTGSGKPFVSTSGTLMLALDNPTSSRQTQEVLGWRPTHPGLIDDLDARHHFVS